MLNSCVLAYFNLFCIFLCVTEKHDICTVLVDHGTNFVGATSDLKEMSKFLN